MQVLGVEELFSYGVAVRPRASSDGPNRSKARRGCCSVLVKGVRSVTCDFADPQSASIRIVIFCGAHVLAAAQHGLGPDHAAGWIEPVRRAG